MKKKFFDLAKKIADMSTYPGAKVGAVITKNNQIISMACNEDKTHPKSRYFHRKLHAELSAILRSRTNLTGCSIYVYRETKTGELAMAKPCFSCQEAIRKSGIRKVYYSKIGGFDEYRS